MFLRKVHLIWMIMLLPFFWKPVLAQEASVQIELEVNAVAAEWSPDGSLIAVGTETGVKVFNLNLEEIATLPDYTQQVVDLSWSPDSNRLAGVGYPYEAGIEFYIPVFTSSLLIWERDEDDNFTLIEQFDYPDQPNVLDVEWSPNGDYLAARISEYLPNSEYTAFADVEIRDTDTWQIISRLQGNYRNMFSDLAWSPDSSLLAVGAEAWCYELRPCNYEALKFDGTAVFVVNPLTGETIYFAYTGLSVYGISWSSNTQIAVASSEIRIYDSTLTNLMGENHYYSQYRLRWMPNQEDLLLWSLNGVIDIVDALNFESRFHLELPEIQALSISSDGLRLAIIDTPQTLSIYDIPQETE